MRYVSFQADGRSSYGVHLGRGVVDLGARLASAIPDLRSYLAACASGFTPPAHPWDVDFDDRDLRYLPVVPNPGKILCVGLNYESHRRETGRAQAAYPAIFTRFADTLVGHRQPLVRPHRSADFDYEGELAVVIGKPGSGINEHRALDHVAGYACFNDATVRDWQRHTHQFTPGKNFPNTGAFGPVLVTPDEVGAIGDQRIETRVNGVVVQSAQLGDMIFGIGRVIAYVSAFTPLATGDIIAMGTPGGVGFKRDPPMFLKGGDQVEVSIDMVGQLANPVSVESVARA